MGRIIDALMKIANDIPSGWIRIEVDSDCWAALVAEVTSENFDDSVIDFGEEGEAIYLLNRVVVDRLPEPEDIF